MSSLSRLSQSLVLAAATSVVPAETFAQSTPRPGPQPSSPEEPPHALGAYYRFLHVSSPKTSTSYDTHGATVNLSLQILRSGRWRLTGLFEGFWTSGFADVTTARSREVNYAFQGVSNLTLSFHPWGWLSVGLRLAVSLDGSGETTQVSASTPSHLPHDRFGGVPSESVTWTQDTSRVNLGLRGEFRVDVRPLRCLQIGGSATFNDVNFVAGSTTPTSPDTSTFQAQGRAVVTIPAGRRFYIVGEGRYTYSLGRDPSGSYTIPTNQLELRLGIQHRF